MHRVSTRTASRAVSAAVAALTLGFAGTAAAATPPPYTTVANIQNLILNSQLGASEALTDVSCVGLQQPKPRRNAAGVWTFHRFHCVVSGSYVVDTALTVVFTGRGTFEWSPA